MQAVKPPPASVSPPLITASVLLSTSHLSSLHHWKGVKISHHKISLPTSPTPHQHLHPIFKQSPSFFHLATLPPPSTYICLPRSNVIVTFLFFASIFPSIYPSRIAISPSLFLSITLLVLPSSFPHLSLSLPFF